MLCKHDKIKSPILWLCSVMNIFRNKPTEGKFSERILIGIRTIYSGYYQMFGGNLVDIIGVNGVVVHGINLPGEYFMSDRFFNK